MDEWTTREWIIELFVNLYIHGNENELFQDWQTSLDTFFNDGNKKPLFDLIKGLVCKYNLRERWVDTIINGIVYKLKALGILEENNQFIEFSLESFIDTRDFTKHFDVHNEIWDYLRLSLKYERKIDIESIHKLFLSYYPRKDYTVINIGAALKTFQKHHLLSMQDSVSDAFGRSLVQHLY